MRAEPRDGSGTQVQFLLFFFFFFFKGTANGYVCIPFPAVGQESRLTLSITGPA